MTDFDFEEHLIAGDADAARSWVESSALSAEQQADLLHFISKFPTSTFVREDDAILDYYEEIDRLTLPEWFRKARSTLAFIHPAKLFRVDDFQWYNSPRADDVGDAWYELRAGYQGEEQRTLLFRDAMVYRIGAWSGTDESYLGIDLHDPGDHRIFDFSGADLRDNMLAERPVRGSLYPIFESYPRLLAHITEIGQPNNPDA
jgi:hypothetical protein